MDKTPTKSIIYRQDAILWLLEKGQKSERYKLGEIWELNFEEIREALSKVPEASLLGGYNPFPEYDFNKTCSQSSKIAELIANMVFNDTDEEELTRIVAYSINVIEAEKCIRKRDESYFDNDIAQLEKKYGRQNSKKKGEK